MVQAFEHEYACCDQRKMLDLILDQDHGLIQTLIVASVYLAEIAFITTWNRSRGVSLNRLPAQVEIEYNMPLILRKHSRVCGF